jgi:hypothetical protein
MRLGRQGGRDTWTAGSIKEITDAGWRVLSEERFKPGVTRAHCVKGNQFRLVYVRALGETSGG